MEKIDQDNHIWTIIQTLYGSALTEFSKDADICNNNDGDIGVGLGTAYSDMHIFTHIHANH